MNKIVRRYKKVITLITIFMMLLIVATTTVYYKRHLLRSYTEQNIAFFLQKQWPNDRVNLNLGKVSWAGWWHPLSLTIDTVNLEVNGRFSGQSEALYIQPKIVSLMLGKLAFDKLSFKNVTLKTGQQELIGMDLDVKVHPDDLELFAQNVRVKCGQFLCLFPNINKERIVFDLPVAGQATLVIKGQDVSGSFDLDVGQGHIKYVPYFPELLSIKEGRLSLSLKDNVLDISTLSLRHNDTDLKIKGQGTFVKGINTDAPLDNVLTLKLEAEARNILVDEIAGLWPQSLAPKPRAWVTTNLSKGHVALATLFTDLKLSFTPAAEIDAHIEDLHGNITANDVLVHYLGDLPPVEHAFGECQYTKNQFIITAHGTVNGIEVQRGHIIIDDLDKEDIYFQLEADLAGPLQSALKVIEYKPLNLTQKLGLDVSKVTGSAVTSLYLKFMLAPDLPLEKVQVEARARIMSGVFTASTPVLGNQNILQDTFCDLVIDNQHLLLTGRSKVLGQESKLEWVEYFQEKTAPFARRLTLAANLDVNREDDQGLIKGNGTIEAIYTAQSNKQGHLKLDADLSGMQVTLPWISYFKEAVEPLSLKVEGALEPQLHLHKLEISGKGVDVESQPSTGMSKPVVLTINEIGDLEGKVAVSFNKEQLRLQGTIVDLYLESFLNDFDRFTKTVEQDLQGDVLLDLNIKNIHCSDQLTLKKSRLRCHWLNGDIMMVDLAAPANKFHLLLSPPKDNLQSLILTAAQGGDVLEVLASGYDLEGGQLEIVGHRQYKDKKAIITGEVDLKNITFVEAPLLAKILSAASLDGVLRLISGDGIYFDHASASFVWGEDVVALNDIHLYGTALGLEAEGTIKGESNDLDFKGEIIPIYSVNHFLNQIPLLGSVLGSSEKKGMFSSAFRIHGNKDDPKISVNALTTIAPTGLREMATNATKSKGSD